VRQIRGERCSQSSPGDQQRGWAPRGGAGTFSGATESASTPDVLGFCGCQRPFKAAKRVHFPLGSGFPPMRSLGMSVGGGWVPFCCSIKSVRNGGVFWGLSRWVPPLLGARRYILGFPPRHLSPGPLTRGGVPPVLSFLDGRWVQASLGSCRGLGSFHHVPACLTGALPAVFG